MAAIALFIINTFIRDLGATALVFSVISLATALSIIVMALLYFCTVSLFL